jgi:hypothetical protein
MDRQPSGASDSLPWQVTEEMGVLRQELAAAKLKVRPARAARTPRCHRGSVLSLHGFLLLDADVAVERVILEDSALRGG